MLPSSGGIDPVNWLCESHSNCSPLSLLKAGGSVPSRPRSRSFSAVTRSGTLPLRRSTMIPSHWVIGSVTLQLSVALPANASLRPSRISQSRTSPGWSAWSATTVPFAQAGAGGRTFAALVNWGRTSGPISSAAAATTISSKPVINRRRIGPKEVVGLYLIAMHPNQCVSPPQSTQLRNRSSVCRSLPSWSDQIGRRHCRHDRIGTQERHCPGEIWPGGHRKPCTLTAAMSPSHPRRSHPGRTHRH